MTRPRWWDPLAEPQCLVIVGLAVLFMFAAVLAGGLWLRATDAEVQLQMCRQVQDMRR